LLNIVDDLEANQLKYGQQSTCMKNQIIF